MSNYRQFYKDYYHLSFNKNIQIHHIDRNKENNDILNLIALPKVLHLKYHYAIDNFYFCVDTFGDGKFDKYFFMYDPSMMDKHRNIDFAHLQHIFSLVNKWRILRDSLYSAINCPDPYGNVCDMGKDAKITLSYIDDGCFTPSISFIDCNNDFRSSFDYQIVHRKEF